MLNKKMIQYFMSEHREQDADTKKSLQVSITWFYALVMMMR